MLKKDEYLIELEGREFVAKVFSVDWPPSEALPAFEFELYNTKGWRANFLENRVFTQPELYEKVQDLILREMIVDLY